MLKSKRVRLQRNVLENLKSNPFLKKEEAEEVKKLLADLKAPAPVQAPAAVTDSPKEAPKEVPKEVPKEAAKEIAPDVEPAKSSSPAPESAAPSPNADEWGDDEALDAYLKEHAQDIAAEGEKPFKAIGGILELLGEDYYPITDEAEAPEPEPAEPVAPKPVAKPKLPVPALRENALQKISHLDVKGRIQLALKGNKEERSLLIRDGTKVVALAVLEAPKLSDGQPEKCARVRPAPDPTQAPFHEKLQSRAQSGGESAHSARPGTRPDETPAVSRPEKYLGQQRCFRNRPQTGAENVQAERRASQQEVKMQTARGKK
jgi:hypothetical protein